MYVQLIKFVLLLKQFFRYRYCLVSIDCYSNKIAVRPMKFKNGLTVRSNMEDMFQNDYKGYPVCVETDQGMLIFLPSIFKFNNIYIYIYILGGEFISNETQKYFKDRDIYFHRKFGKTKAFRVRVLFIFVEFFLICILPLGGIYHMAIEKAATGNFEIEKVP